MQKQSIQSQSCPSGWTSYPTIGHAMGFVNTGGSSPDNAMGNISHADNASNATSGCTLDAVNETLVMHMGDLVSAGSVMTMALARDDSNTRVKVESSTDKTNWNLLGYYSTTTPADVFYSNRSNKVSHHFQFTVPAGGLRYVRFVLESGKVIIDAVRFRQICRPVCTDGLVPATAVVAATNTPSHKQVLSFDYREGASSLGFQASAAGMEGAGQSSITVDLGTVVSGNKNIVLSMAASESGGQRRLELSTSTDNVTYTLLTTIGRNTSDNAEYWYSRDREYHLFTIPIPVSGARYVKLTDTGANNSGTDYYIDGIGYGCYIYDYGDVRDVTTGNASNDYSTLSSQNGPAHYGQYPGTYTLESFALKPLLHLNGAPTRETEAREGYAAINDENENITLPNIGGCDNSYTIPAANLTGVNNTGETATIHAWLDINSNGQFEAAEYASATFLAGATSAAGSLQWNNLPAEKPTYMFMRVRITTIPLTDNAATSAVDERSLGLALTGEVEDHRVNVTTLKIKEILVGDCVNNEETGFTPKVLVAVQLEWANFTGNPSVTLTLGNETKPVATFERGLPEYIQYIRTPDGSTQTLTLASQLGACYNASTSVTLPASCPLPICGSSGQVGGQVFIDYNSNGQVNGKEPGYEGIPVKVYNEAGTLVCDVTTGNQGKWVCQTNLSNGSPVRVEFFVPEGYYPGLPGQQSRSAIQFDTVGSCSFNLGILRPSDFLEDNPWLVVPCFTKGDVSNPSSPAANDPTLVANRFLSNGGVGTKNVYIAKGSETGTLWGVAFQPETNHVFSSSFMRRHTALGPGGLGAIYKTSINTIFQSATGPANGSSFFGNTSLLLNLDNYGIETGNENLLNRDIPANPTQASRDSMAFSKVGKWGLGDIDINEGHDTIWVINLYNRSLVTIVMGKNSAGIPTANVASVSESALPVPLCASSSDWRPFALKYKKGELYIGGVCSAESTQEQVDMRAIVYRYKNGIYTEVLNYSLDYVKGAIQGNSTKSWLPWTDYFGNLRNVTGGYTVGPVPMLCDIEFNPEGHMILGFGDRVGYQLGSNDYSPESNTLIKTIAGGDVQLAVQHKGTFLIENNGKAGFLTSAGGVNNDEGPGGGEFFNHDTNGGGSAFHNEVSLGGLTVHPLYNHVTSVQIDATQIASNGWRRFDLLDGSKEAEYDVFEGNNIGKAAGLGDVELMVGATLPNGPGLKIGNYVWFDEDEDGIQDPGETPVAGVDVFLYKKNGTYVDSVQTDANGYYLFTNVLAKTQYIIILGRAQNYVDGSLLINGEKYEPTLANATGGAASNENDSDGESLSGTTIPATLQNKIGVCLTTGLWGENDFTFDFGLVEPQIKIGNYVWLDEDKDGIQDTTEPVVPSVPVLLFKKNGTPVDTTTTNAQGLYEFRKLDPATEYIIVFGEATNYNNNKLVVGGISYQATLVNAGNDDALDSDAQVNVSGIPASLSTRLAICLTTAGPGSINYTYDLGLKTEGIGSLVWKDLNLNGYQDPEEEGLEGITVNLHTCVGTTPGVQPLTGYSVETNGSGQYLIQGAPAGRYALSFDFTDHPLADTLRFTIPNIEFNGLDAFDSDILRSALNVDTKAFTGCFDWNPAAQSLDLSHDAGLFCEDILIDPTGYIYCEANGEILSGGLVTVSGPGNVYMIYDGSNGFYQFFVDATGNYDITVQTPPTYLNSVNCLSSGFLDAPDSLALSNPYVVGYEDLDGDGFLDNFQCNANRFYTTMLLEPGDYIVNNNFPMSCLDLGDLPSSYPTILSANGPRHALLQRDSIWMGIRVDAEGDGQPNAMAGIMGGGDDGSSPSLDDEDGLVALPFVVPNAPLQFMAKATNSSSTTAYMKAFIDLNYDFDFTDPGESQMVTVPANTFNGMYSFTFAVPASVPFGVKIGLRLRLSANPAMTATGLEEEGEIEDYVLSVISGEYGNYVWLDEDKDGIQDAAEDPVAGVPVILYLKNGTPVDTTTTDADGQYLFTNLTPAADYIIAFGTGGMYAANKLVIDGVSYEATLADAGTNDSLDSDARINLSGIPANLASRYAICFTAGAAGTNNYTYDLGLTVEGIGNLVWKDLNLNGFQDEDEQGLQGVTVSLHACSGNTPNPAPLSGYTVTTNQNGQYLIQGAPQGTYAVSFDFTNHPLADTLRFTMANIEFNGLDNDDSDVLRSSLNTDTKAFTGCFVWNPASDNLDLSQDAGLFCEDILIDPTGYIYCEANGEILTGGLVTVTGPGNVYMIHDGSNGFYQFFVDATGNYNLTVQNPATYVKSVNCLSSGFLDAPDSLALSNPYVVGYEDIDGDGFLDNFQCNANRFYTTMLLEPGDYIVNNNFPMSCLDFGDLPPSYPVLLANNGPRHALLQRDSIWMGTIVDAEGNGVPETMAGIMGGGDDGSAGVLDDEDGLQTLPVIIPNTALVLMVKATNTSATTAYVKGFVDFNNDFDFNDAGETQSAIVPAGSLNTMVSLSFATPANVPQGVKLGVRLRMSFSSVMEATGLEEEGEIEDYVLLVGGYDYGDHPQTYVTSGAGNPPRHLISTNLYLGSSVDSESDGQPEAMSGMMTGGDDNTLGLVTFGTSTPDGDDENGIMLASPMVPGSSASFMVDVHNQTGATAIVQAWVDFNGNGSFETNEQLTSGSFAPSGANVPVGGLQGAKLTFDIPATASFTGGNAFVRLRLSPAGGLSPNNQTGTPPFGEIEDYKFSLGKVGNYVWEDRDFDGVQDAGEPAIDNIPVTLVWAGPDGNVATTTDNKTYTTTTGPASGQQSGEYYICGLTAGTYKLIFTTPANMTPTRPNIGSQTGGGTADADGTLTGMDLSMAMETFTIANVTALPTGENGTGDAAPNAVGSFPDAQTDETHDMGFAYLDYGDLPESGNGDAFNSTMTEVGAVHVIIPGLKLGASVDGERDGTGSATAIGDDNSNTGSADDEDGVSFVTPLIPGYNATVAVTAMNMTGANAFLQGWIDWNNNGLLDSGEALAFTNNGVIPAGGVSNAPYIFPVPATAIFNDGMVFARFRLSPTGGLTADGPDKYNASTTVPQGEVEDYKLDVAKIGNYVWEDRDFDGAQDAGEPPINGVAVAMTWGGADGDVGTVGDNLTYLTTTGPVSGQQSGEYYFCGLTPGTYKLVYTSPANMTPTRSNIGSQTNGGTMDADGLVTGMDMSMAMETFTIGCAPCQPLNENGTGDNGSTPTGTFPDLHTDETHDMGFAFLDYGDLPESGNGDVFNSTMAEGGAVHVIVPGLKLGANVDGERNGTGSATAEGDDNSNTGSADDEDGIQFATPLIPGYNATVAVTAMNMTGANAFLQGWIDWNNNGLLDSGEALAFTNNGVIPAGGVSNAPYTFPVPATAIFNDGMVFARFRLSPTGGLTADGPDKYNATTTVPVGEVEDYKLNVAKIGNYVWEDRDFDGAQDAGEPAIDGVTVTLVWAGADNTIGGNDDVNYTTTTGPASNQQAGVYYFCGLTPGTYKLVYTSPANMTPTRSNIGSQTNGGTMDADGLVTGMDMSMAMETFTIGCAPCQPLNENGTGDNGSTPTGTFPDLHTDETHDQGFAYLDYGDLPESGNGDAFNTTMAEVGAVHVIIPGLKLGANVDGERNGTGSATAEGDDNNNTGSADDEDGIQFVTPLIPGYNATIAVTAMNMTGSNAVLQGWIDWNNNGLLDSGEALAFTNNGVIPAGGVSNAPYTFPVPATAIFNDGMVFARFRLSPTGGLTADGPDKYNASTTVPAGEVEDYKKNLVKIGNYVWEDYDFDGQQDATEPGIGNIPVQLIWAGADANLMTPADNVVYSTTTLNAPANGNVKGEYNFCGLIEGTYKIAITSDPGYAPTVVNTGDQTNGGYTDSDGLLVPAGAFPGLGGAMVMTDPIVISLAGITQQPTNENGIGDNSPGVLGTFPNNQTNESYDFGFVAVDYGDLPNTYATLNGTTNAGAMHIIQPGKFLGMGVDAEMDAQVDGAGTAGMWTLGDDNATSPLFFGMVTNGDDEDGVTFITPLVPGYSATARIKYTSVDVPGLPRADKTYLSAWMDMNGDGVFGAQDKIISDLPLALGTDVVRNVTFTVPSTATFNGGAARVRFRLHCQPGLGSAGLTVGGEVEDYYIPVAKAGNYVWFDNDLRGDEMTTDAPIDFATEAGINNVDMVLIWGGLDQNLSTVADNRVYKVKTRSGNQGENQDGIYYFCGLIEGQYRVVPAKYASTLPGAGIDSLWPSDPALAVPVRKILAIGNNVAGNDGKDSDGTPSLTFAVPNLLASPNATLNVLGENNLGDLPNIYNFPDRLTNMSLDFGYIQQPNIELNQKIAGVEKGGECGNFKVIVDLSIRNSGGHQNNYVMAVPLANIQAEVPLKTQLGNAFVMTMGAPQIMNGKWECGTAALPQQLPVVNAGFNGSTDTRLFNGNTGLLWPGEEVVVRYVFEVRPTNVPMPESLNLMFQASGSGKAVNYQGQPVPDYFNGGVQYMAMDLSDDGLEFNGTYDDPDFKTVIGPCWNSANTLAANNSINVSIAPGECKALITDAMVLEGEPDACTDENFCLQGYFRVYILDEYGNELPNPIDVSYIGRKLKVEVENIVTCRRAWGYMNLEYKQPPVVKCTDVTLKCTDELKNLPVPTVESCLPYTTTFTDNAIPSKCDGQYWEVVERTWTAEDSQGNSSYCVQHINIQRQSLSGMCARIIDFDDTDKPSLDCKGNWARDEKGNPSTLVTGVPDVQGCNVICTYEDKVIDVCGNSQFIERTWTCMDWCTNGTTQCVQKIRIADKFGPVLSGTGEYEYGSPDVSSCQQQIRFAKPEVDDNCSEVIRMSISVGGIAGEFYYKLDGKVLSDSKYYPAVGYAKIPVGTHTILYTAEDACGNVTTATETLVVNDGVTPVAVSKQNVVVSLTGNGGGSGAAKLYVHQVDNGSYDNCGPVRLEIRRKSGGACGNVGADGMHNNNSTFNDNNGVASENPGQTWFHNPGDNKFDTDGGEYVTFCCEDIPAGEDHGLHEVELRVWDDANRNGIAGDNLIINGVRDNYNTTWATIRVENKLAPVLVCPADATVTCDMDIFLSLDGKVTKVKDVNLSMTGEARAYDLCSGLDVTYTDSWLGGSNPVCKTGKIRRVFTATKGSVTVTCAQIIELTSAGKAFTVTFPQRGGVSEWPSCSLSLEDVRNTANSTIKRPITDYGQCDIVGENITIDTFLFEDGACKKWRVTYKYINWCTGQEITTINGQPIVYYYTYKDEVAPVLTCSNVMVSANPNANNVNGGCEGSVVLSATATDALVCAEESWIKWQAFADLWANGTTDRIASSFVNKAWNGIWARVDKFVAGQVNPNWSALQAQHANMVLADVVYVTYVAPSKASGGTVSLPAFTLDAENISHRVQWRVTDGCGNVDLCESTIMVVDKKAPTPYCIGVSTALMQTNPKMVELWARDFDKGSYDNCTPQSKLYYTFRDGANNTHPVLTKLNDEHFFKGAGQVATVSEYNSGKAYKWLPSSRSAGKVFTAAGKLNIDILVWDEQLNADFCTVELTIISNDNTGSRIAGTVSTEKGQAVAGVEVIVDANVIEYPQSMMTTSTGLYDSSHANGVDYTVKAAKNDELLNGVSTLDIVMIQRHILGIETLGSSYQWIAADANNDDKVTAADLSALRKLVLGVADKLPNDQQSWRFAVSGTSVSTNPVSFTERIDIANLTTDMVGQDFVAVKIGDVNGNVSTNVSNPATEGRSNKEVVLTVADQEVGAGEVVEIPVTAANFKDVAGYQFTMNLKGASYVGVNSGTLAVNAANVGVISNEVITMSYASETAVNAAEGEVLFTLVVKAEEATSVGQMLRINSSVTPAESYTGELAVGGVRLEERATGAADIELMQNEPNPFRGQTTVRFKMPKAGKATLKVLDVTGKVLAVRNIEAVRGLNTEVFTREQLGASGVLYYTLESGDFTATKKMILVE